MPVAVLGIGALIGASIATAMWHPRPRWVWNATGSSPTGLYAVVHGRPPARGDWVIAWAPPAARVLGSIRGYLPANVPLVKQVAAASGDRVCAAGDGIWINGRRSAARLSRDSAGRPMPWWSGCKRLDPGDLFLLSATVPDAFDGRYFGVTGAGEIVGRADLLWRG